MRPLGAGNLTRWSTMISLAMTTRNIRNSLAPGRPNFGDGLVYQAVYLPSRQIGKALPKGIRLLEETPASFFRIRRRNDTGHHAATLADDDLRGMLRHICQETSNWLLASCMVTSRTLGGTVVSCLGCSL